MITTTTPDRPRCAYCDRPLRLFTRTISRAYPGPRVEVGETVEIDGQPVTVLKVTKRRIEPECIFNRRQYADVFFGRYDRLYGEFDTLHCALWFARAAFAVGYRITKKA